ncbi:cupin domain-containing protein [bacterium]|nr:cupin domain-containing protein [bacterium]
MLKKNISAIERLSDLLDFKKESITSKAIIDKGGGTITLFAFDKAQGLGTHTSPMVTVLHCIEGSIQITIDKVVDTIGDGEIVTVPPETPLSILSINKAKVLFTRIKS